jgi:hypothetical protein
MMWWVGDVVRMVEKQNCLAYETSVRKPHVHKRIILKWILKKQYESVEFLQLTRGKVAGYFDLVMNL